MIRQKLFDDSLEDAHEENRPKAKPSGDPKSKWWKVLATKIFAQDTDPRIKSMAASSNDRKLTKLGKSVEKRCAT